MATKRRYPLREVIRTVAGIALFLASLTELLSVLFAYGASVDGRMHLFFAVMAVAGALLIFLNIGYSAYIVLPFALGIFFYEIYRTAASTISLYTVVSAISFFVTALLCFMLIRAHKI
jgi:hypothetical protein